MDITLMDLFLVMGVIAFTLLATLFFALLVLVYQINKKVREVQSIGSNFMRDALIARYGLKVKLFKMILSWLGGGRNRE